MIDINNINNKILNFQLNKNPIDSLKFSFPKISGIPPKSVPEGQIHLQNQGFPPPATFTIATGKIITNIIKTIYFRYFRYLSP